MFGIIGLILLVIGFIGFIIFQKREKKISWECLKIKSQAMSFFCKIKQECGLKPESIEFEISPNLFIEFRKTGDIVFWRVEDDTDNCKIVFAKKRTYSQMLNIIEGFFKETNG